MKKMLLTTAVVAWLAGCAAPGGTPDSTATLAPAPVDAGPFLPTAVTSTAYSIDGRILPVVRGTETIQTRVDMRRSDSTLTFDNFLLRQVAGDGRTATIARLDSQLMYTLYPAKQTYKECPLLGCPLPARTTDDKPQKAAPAKSADTAPTCPLTVRKNDLRVVAMADRRTINAWDTQHYQMTWTLEVADPQKRRTTSSIVMDLWTTSSSAMIQDVQRINDQYNKRFMTAIGLSEHPMSRYLPKNIAAVIDPLVRNATGKSTDSTKLFALWGKEFAKIQGYPISTTMSLNIDGNACANSSSDSPDASSTSAPPPTSLGGLLGNVMGNVAQDKAKQGATSGALLTFTSEVKAMDVHPVSDSTFVPPPTYQKIP